MDKRNKDIDTPRPTQSAIFEKPKPGFSRWLGAVKNSYDGLIYALKNEAAVREECIVLLVATPLAFYVAHSALLTLLLILSVVFVLIVEILNSALEATLDRVSLDIHPLVKAAKDLGSLAVNLAILSAIAVWLTVIFFT